METFFKAFSKIWKNNALNRYEKDVLITLLGFWSDAKKKHYSYIQKSYREIMYYMGETDPHLIQKYVNNLVNNGFVEIINKEEVRKSHFPPKIILKEDNINNYFKGEFFKNPKAKEDKPGESLSSSTNPFRREETKVQKGNCAAAWTEPTEEHLAEVRKINLEYISGLARKREEQLKKKKYGN